MRELFKIDAEGSEMTEEEREEVKIFKALEDCVGALQFILAFYEPGQRTLDTWAWKAACARGVAAYLQGAPLVGWEAHPLKAVNGEVHRGDKK